MFIEDLLETKYSKTFLILSQKQIVTSGLSKKNPQLEFIGQP